MVITLNVSNYKTYKQVMSYVKTKPDIKVKSNTLEELLARVDAERKAGKKTVFTEEEFDLYSDYLESKYAR
jgi:hypothetical protein